MSQPTPKPAVCRRLVFDEEEPLPSLPRSLESANNPPPEAVIPEYLKEACEDNINNYLVEEMEHCRATSKLKWNFDFEQEMPLEGNWEWEKIEPSTDHINNTNLKNKDMKDKQTKV